MAAKDNEDAKSEVQEEEISLDMSQAAVKKMIAEARERGYITYDQLNQVLPPDQVSSDQIEDVMSMLSEMGIQVTEDDEEAEEDDANKGSKLLNMFNPEVEVGWPGAPEWAGFVRLHHRSGIFGLINGVTGGSTYMTFGLRKRFAVEGY